MTEDTMSGEQSPLVSGADIRTFLFADMRGYTRFTQEHGDEAASALAGRFADLVRETVPAFEGELLELRGDEALCVFRSARQALRASVELQRRLRTGTDEQSAFPIGVGMGLDAGEAIPTQGGYRGASLNLAARLCAAAKPGEVLATSGVVHLARRVDGIGLVARRALRLKGIAEAVQVVEVVAESPLPPVPVIKPVSSRRSRPMMVGAVILAMLVLGLVGVVFVSRSGSSKSSLGPIRIRPNSIGAIDPTTGRVLADRHADMSGFAPYMAGGDGAVWTYGTQAQNLYRIDARTYGVQQFGIAITPNDITTSDGQVWLVDGWDGWRLQVDAISPSIITKTRMPLHTTPGAHIASVPTAVWIEGANDSGGISLLELNPQTGGVVHSARTVGGDIAADGPYVWLQQFNSIREIRPQQGGQVSILNTTGNPPPSFLAAGFGYAWFATNRRVWKISPAPVTINDAILLPTSPYGIAIGDGLVWVATYNEIVAINPVDDSITRRFPLANPVSAITYYDGRVWVARN